MKYQIESWDCVSNMINNSDIFYLYVCMKHRVKKLIPYSLVTWQLITIIMNVLTQTFCTGPNFSKSLSLKSADKSDHFSRFKIRSKLRGRP